MELTASKLNSLYEATRAHKVEGHLVILLPTMNAGDLESVQTLITRLHIEGFTVTPRVVDINEVELLIF